MDHSEINVIGLQPFQEILKSGTDISHISCPKILLVLPGGADMALNKPLAAILLDSFSDDVSRFRIGHPAVQNVDPLRSSIMNQLDTLLFRMALQPFSSKTDLTDLKLCFS